MRSVISGTVATVVLCVLTMPVWAQRPSTTRRAAPAGAEAKTASDADRNTAEGPLRAVAVAYAKAYNAHDAKAIAGMFTPDAQIVDEAGDAIQGRDAIEQVFAEVFREFPEACTSIAIKSIRFLNPNLAVEDGTASVVLVPGEPSEASDYTVAHVKQDGKWLMVSAHDLSSEGAPASEHLKQLGWLIGEWVDESPESLIITDYRWDENHNFVLSDFSIKVAGRPVMSGSQRIGWDPLAKVIRSWIFDSEGGFAEGVYSRDGDRWIIKVTGVTRDGQPASATNVITRASKDRLTWQSRDRMIGGEPGADIGEVTVVRTPPKPM